MNGKKELLETLEKAEEDVKDGRVAPIKETFLNIDNILKNYPDKTKKHRTDYLGDELQPLNYWKKRKMVPKEDAEPLRLWCNPHHQNAADYYTAEQVRPMTDIELEEMKAANREKRNKYKERKKMQEEAERKAELEMYQQLADEAAATARYEVGSRLSQELIKYANNLPAEPCKNNTGMIVIDLETTGLSHKMDEILQISIIDGNGNVLMNEYCCPYWSESWHEAEKVNGINMEMVEQSLYFHTLIPKIKGIIESAELIVGYNVSFDISFLETRGISFDNKKIYDVMEAFAGVYGEWDDTREDYTWQKLTTCAAYYGYEFKAHDSLEDVKATLFAYKKIKNK